VGSFGFGLEMIFCTAGALGGVPATLLVSLLGWITGWGIWDMAEGRKRMPMGPFCCAQRFLGTSEEGKELLDTVY